MIQTAFTVFERYRTCFSSFEIFYKDHIKNSCKVANPSVWHIHEYSIHSDFFL